MLTVLLQRSTGLGHTTKVIAPLHPSPATACPSGRETHPCAPVRRHGAGINDDLNKAVWAALNLEPELSVEEIVGQYARLHFGAEHEAAMTQVLLGLEENWGGDREPEHFPPRILCVRLQSP